ncbi:MAG: M90 family metallopeptidase [Pirellulaceae bacterium]
MFDLWTKNWRRKRILRQPIPARWPEILAKTFWYWHVLTPAQQARLLSLIAIFLREKEVVVPGNVKDPEGAKVTVAAAACLMLLGFDDWYCFDRITTVVLSTRPIVNQMPVPGTPGVVGDFPATGVYTSGSPVQLSWPDVAEECRDPASYQNVVVHEFAHHIDDLDGSLAGDPPFPSTRLVKLWEEVSAEELELLQQQTERGEDTVLDAYGTSDPVEFFAVTCESFFCNPNSLYESHPRLFSLLQTLFRLDPRQWFEDERP